MTSPKKPETLTFEFTLEGRPFYVGTAREWESHARALAVVSPIDGARLVRLDWDSMTAEYA